MLTQNSRACNKSFIFLSPGNSIGFISNSNNIVKSSFSTVHFGLVIINHSLSCNTYVCEVCELGSFLYNLLHSIEQDSGSDSTRGLHVNLMSVDTLSDVVKLVSVLK